MGVQKHVLASLAIAGTVLFLAGGCGDGLAAVTGEVKVVPLLGQTPPQGGIQLTEVQQGASLFQLQKSGAGIMSASFLFWGPNWGWQGAEAAWSKAGEGMLKVDGLGISGPIRRSAQGRTISYSLGLTAAKATPGATGGALVFTLDQAAAERLGRFNAPKLDGARGFAWQEPGGGTVRVTFEPAVAAVEFEQGRPTEIRAWLYRGEIPSGPRSITVKVELPEGGSLGKSLDERYGPAKTEAWLSGVLDPERSFVDLSFLNKPEAPAGKRGFLRAKGEDLEFADGSKVRFWGANVQAYSLFVTDKAKIDAQVKRLSALGFNLVRLHHHDSSKWVNPSLIAPGPTSQQINAQALDSYFYWIAKLKEAGIYVFLDLQTGRPFRRGDNIPGFEEMAKSGGDETDDTRGFSHINPRIQELMRKFARDLLSRPNPYTKLPLKDDPAVAGILLTNENDITHHFGNALLGDKGVPYHHRIFAEKAAAFARTHGLNPDAVMRTWEPGDSKRFLNDLEHSFSREWIEDLRKLGVKVPIVAGHQWGSNPQFSMPALMAGDIVDAHGYDQGEWIDGDPRAKAGVMQWLAAAQAEGKPFYITEWNTEDAANARDPFALPLHIAAIGAFQGWDAPMIYGYSQDGLNLGPGGMWSSYTHPGVMGMMPAAALAFRRDVSQAKETVRFVPSEKDLLDTALSPENSLLLRTAPERHRLVFGFPKAASLPWLKPSAQAGAVSDPQKSYIEPGKASVQSDTGEILRDFASGIQFITTPRTAAIQGWIGGRKVMAGVFEVESRTPKASISFSSLDGKPLAESSRILVSSAARVVNKEGRYLSEPVEADVRVRRQGLKVYPIRPDGSLGPAKPLDAQGAFAIGAADKTHWYMLAP